MNKIIIKIGTSSANRSNYSGPSGRTDKVVLNSISYLNDMSSVSNGCVERGLLLEHDECKTPEIKRFRNIFGDYLPAGIPGCLTVFTLVRQSRIF